MKRIHLALMLLLAAAPVLATPSISGISGTPGNNNPLVIFGSGLGSHPNGPANQRPSLYADFESSINPDSTLGLTSTWNNLSACMQRTNAKAAEGSWAIRADVQDPNNCQVEAFLRLNFSWDLGNYVVADVHRINEADADKSENWKYWRTSENGGGNIWPNFYIGEAPDSSPYGYTEVCSNTTHKKFFGYSQPNSAWKEDGLFLYKGTSEFVPLGYWKSRQNSVINASSTTYAFNCGAQDTGPYDEFNIQDDISNDREGVSGFIYYDGVYIDTSTNHFVMFIDSSSLAGATKFWMQPYNGASDSSWTITQKFGSIVGSTSVWIVACQDGNDCSSPFRLNSGGGAPAPTVTSVVPNSGTTLGGSTVTVSGTNFVATPTFTFGGTSAQSVVFVNSTTLTVVTPAHAAGAVTGQATNPDAQNGSLGSAYTFVTPPTPPAPSSGTAFPFVKP